MTDSHSPVLDQAAPLVGSEPRWLVLVRFIVAVLLGGGLSRLLWSRVPSALNVKTDIVGYQIFANFNSFRYTNGYYVIALVFPAVTFVIYLLISWRGPLGRRTRPVQTMFPVSASGEMDDDLTATAAGARRNLARTMWSIARVGLVAFVVAVEVSIGATRNTQLDSQGACISAILYVGTVLCMAGILRISAGPGRRSQHGSPKKPWGFFVSRVNSLLALCVIPLLYCSSRGTNIAVGTAKQIVRYPWFPLWLMVALSLAAFLLWRRESVRANSLERADELEAKVLTWAVGPIALFLALAVLPGAIGSFQAFDDAQFLAAPQLIFQHGLNPWRDMYIIHGILNDVLQGKIGMITFGNSRWGADTGFSLIVNPVNWLAVYAFAAYFCRKNRLVVFGVSVAIATGLLQGNTTRFLLLPVFFILFDLMLRRPSWARCSLFMFVLFAGTILTPEEALFVPCFVVTIFLFELAGRQPGASLASNFLRSWRCVVVGAILSIAWGVYLASTHSLVGFFDYFLVFSQGHGLEGGFRTQWNLAHDLAATFAWSVPTTLWLATLWRVIRKLRTRSPWLIREWVMVAAAMCAAIYFPKALDRADVGHVLESFFVAIPLLILWVIDLLERGDQWSRRLLTHRSRFVGPCNFRHVATGAGLAILVIGTIGYSTTIPDVLRRLPGDFHQSVAQNEISPLEMMGYTQPGTVDIAQIEALGKVLERYAGTSSPVFDYANEMGISYYLLNRVPGARFYHSEIIQTTLAQNQTIADLRASRPRIVIFTDSTFGLPSYDGIPQPLRSYSVSEYLLAHYRPLLDVQGQLLLLRDDLFATAPPVPADLSSPGLYFDSLECNFGDIPNFFDTPSGISSQTGVGVIKTEVADSAGTISGWAFDSSRANSPIEVLAVTHGRVVASGPTGLPRPDVAVVLHNPAAANSGFSIGIPATIHGPVSMYVLNGDGTVSPLRLGTVSAKLVRRSTIGTVRAYGGTSRMVVSGPGTGSVDAATRDNVKTFKLSFPPGRALAAYSWIRIASPDDLGNGTYTLSDQTSPSPGHMVTFNTLSRAGRTVNVQVGSCLQWHGYNANTGIYVVQTGHEQPFSVSLVR
jgi:hypothetical protein